MQTECVEERVQLLVTDDVASREVATGQLYVDICHAYVRQQVTATLILSTIPSFQVSSIISIIRSSNVSRYPNNPMQHLQIVRYALTCQ